MCHSYTAVLYNAVLHSFAFTMLVRFILYFLLVVPPLLVVICFCFLSTSHDLYRASGKFELLERIFPKLKRANHK